MSRAAIAMLSTENLLHNLSVIKNQAPRAKIMAMVKANAYGHGIRSVALRLAPYIDTLGVASIDEALALRKVGIRIPITLIEGVFGPDELLIASCEHFHVVFHHAIQLQWLSMLRLPLPLHVWVKVDTGMGRIGFMPHEFASVYKTLIDHPSVHQPIGLMSHFSCADEEHPLNAVQLKQFEELASLCVGPKSFANSAAIFRFPQAHYDYVRPGLCLYGPSPLVDSSSHDFNLKPVMTLQTRLISVRTYPEGSYIGYGARFQCRQDTLVGIMAMGYGDGYPRNVSDGTPILVKNTVCFVVGRVSMDMAAINLTNCPDAKIGDVVTLWGDALPIDEVAPFTGHVAYDLLTGVQSRVKFHWTMNGG